MLASDLDDLAPVIGYRATRIVSAWFAGRRLHVPEVARADHPLELLLGWPAFAALVREFAGCRVNVPAHEHEARYVRDRRIAEMLAGGWTCERVASDLGLSTRRVEQIRVDLVDNGWLRYAQGFDSAMARGRNGRRASVPPELIAPCAATAATAGEKLGTGGVFGETPPPGQAGVSAAG